MAQGLQRCPSACGSVLHKGDLSLSTPSGGHLVCELHVQTFRVWLQRQDWSSGLPVVAEGSRQRAWQDSTSCRQLFLSRGLHPGVVTIAQLCILSFPTHLPLLCLDASAILIFSHWEAKGRVIFFNIPRRARTLRHMYMDLSRLAKAYYYHTRIGVGKLRAISQIWSPA